MSSVVNKSGTRFVPKARQRRSQGPAKPIIAKPVSVVVRDPALDNTGSILNDDNDDSLDGATQVPIDKGQGKIQNMNNNNDDNDTHLSQESTQVETINRDGKASIDGSVIRSKRLGSLSEDSSDRPNFKNKYQHLNKLGKISGNGKRPNSNSTVKNSRNESNSTRRRRLSSISNGLPGNSQVLESIKSEKATLDTLKRRRLSRKIPVSQRSRSKGKNSSTASKISVPSATGIPIPTGEDFNGNGNRDDGDNDNNNEDEDEDGGFQRTSDQYKKYVIKSVRDIPKGIEDKDSSRYLIDENNFTMAELCKRTLPIGEVSDNFERSKMAYKAKLQRRKELRELRQKARSEFKSLQELNKENEEMEKQRRREAQEKLMNADIPEERFNQTMKLKLTADGTIAVDEESTIVDRHKNASLEHAQKKKVDENPFNNLFNNGTYGKKSYTDPWTPDEMVKYYRALSMWGTDFNLISQLFPYRTRRQIKSKFVNEEKKHPLMIELALRSKLPADFEQYCRDIRKNIPTLEEFDEKIKSLQREHELHIKELEAAKQTAKLEDQDNEKEFENKDMSNNRRGAGGFTGRDLQTFRKQEVVLGTIDDVKRKREEEERKIPDESDNEEESEEEEESDDEDEK